MINVLGRVSQKVRSSEEEIDDVHSYVFMFFSVTVLASRFEFESKVSFNHMSVPQVGILKLEYMNNEIRFSLIKHFS